MLIWIGNSELKTLVTNLFSFSLIKYKLNSSQIHCLWSI